MPSSSNNQEQIRLAIEALSAAVREMTPVGAKAIPVSPVRFNLLARPHKDNCGICKYPGHKSLHLSNANACRVALMSTVGWWEDVAVHGAFLYEVHEEFHKAANANEPDYEMRHDSSPIKGKTFEEIFVNRLTRNYLKFQAHFNTIRPKAMKFLHDHDVARFQQVSTKLNDLLLKGQTLSDLFKQSIAGQDCVMTGT